MKKHLSFAAILLTGLSYAQSAQLTPINDLGTHVVTVAVPAKYTAAFTGTKTLKVPTNYSVSVFHAGGLSKPRFMAFSPTGILHVSDAVAGKVFALPDVNMDGVADTMIVAATGFIGNHDVKFYKGAMYVTEELRIWKCTDLNADGIYETKTIFINNIGNNLGGHVTRTVVFDSINQKAYVSIGSSCNVCRESDRAIIEVYDENGTNGSVFASGVRNAVGMSLHPVTNRLWANNNGSDQQGNEIPPEWIDIVRENGFYGHPFAYGSGVWFDFTTGGYQSLLPITATDSVKVASVVPPAALIRAHSAPMALQFLNSQFGTTMQHGFLSALRGSWNTTDPNDFRGYKVIYGHLSSAQDTTVSYVADFCSGFITDTVNRIFWGRPVGIAIDNTGKVYISSDEANKVILVLTPNGATAINENSLTLNDAVIFPNPVKDRFTLTLTLNQPEKTRITLTDVFGREVMHVENLNLSTGDHAQQIDVSALSAGYYFITVKAGHSSITKKLIVTD
jgi:glucose/arabinose dehydrogenase